MSLDLPIRPRRLRSSPAIRTLAEETKLTTNDLICPLFIKPESGGCEDIPSLPGIRRLTPDAAVKECAELLKLGICAVAPFPCAPANLKDETGSASVREDQFFHQTLRRLKQEVPGMLLFVDVALDPYTSHGHDGILGPDGDVDNDATVERLAEMAVTLAHCGVDFVAPSDMMDGRIGAIRTNLDASGFIKTGILAYSAKFASAYYGPFRDAVSSALKKGTYLDKKTYQLNPANRREALRDALFDESEGADILMVKPAGLYLDILRELRDSTLLPLAAYQVSGEYAQIHAAAQNGWLDLRAARDESLLAIKRAGSDMILTYFSRAIAEDLQKA